MNTMKIMIAASILVFIGATMARADNPHPMTGAELAGFCSGGGFPTGDATNTIMVSMCSGYIIGIGEVAQQLKTPGLCLPTKITAFPLLNDIEGLTKANPTASAVLIVQRALRDTYPCAAK